MRLQLTVLPLITELGVGIVLPAASIDVPAAIVPALMTLERSVRTACASLTAPSTLSAPAPC